MIRLALVVCDEPDSTVHGDYVDLFGRLLSASLARVDPDAEFALDAFDVFRGTTFPPDDVPYDALLVTGSRFSAYDDVPWINALVAYLERVLAERPSTKLFGICFGHQVIARALGGACVPNGGRWEVAVTSVQLTPLGQAIFGSDHLDLQQMHRDHVPTVPPNAHVLGSTPLTPNHGMVVFHSEPTLPVSASTPVPLTSIRILTLQGHPEFTPPFMSMLLNSRISLLGQTLVDDGLARVGGIPGRRYPDGLACDGVEKVGRAIWGVLGLVPSQSR